MLMTRSLSTSERDIWLKRYIRTPSPVYCCSVLMLSTQTNKDAAEFYGLKVDELGKNLQEIETALQQRTSTMQAVEESMFTLEVPCQDCAALCIANKHLAMRQKVLSGAPQDA